MSVPVRRKRKPQKKAWKYVAELYYIAPKQPMIVGPFRNGGTLIHVSRKHLENLALPESHLEWMATQLYGGYGTLEKELPEQCGHAFCDISYIRNLFGIPVDTPSPEAIPEDDPPCARREPTIMQGWAWAHFDIHQDSSRPERALPMGRYV